MPRQRHRLRDQFVIHWVMPFQTQLLSTTMVTRDDLLSTRSPSGAALISMRLLVVLAEVPPAISISIPSVQRMAAQPPGPGLRSHAPSV